ncbi:thymidylate kinase [Clostridium sp. JN-9]|uniref:dTMP kinase n=1 Tax=Clostridium sp. JN-9 TaxID=2507159 RepID=UPI000FFE2905|nr:thymidylate kinase [Clostridium sp. JN-9]QAT38858.1 thymidylate kinase [Clostridium sp. JN-9]
MQSTKENKGKVIAIEGSDGSGKATQTKLLYDTLISNGVKVKKVEFPNYKSDSSALVKMYLNGEFGDEPGDVSPYVASTFYAVDRYASFMKEWKRFYNEGGIIIADRYTTSNMIHQAAKIENKSEKEEFLHWMYNLEYKIFNLPEPDCVIFLDMPPEYSYKLMKERKNKFTGDQEKDIHEKHKDYLLKSYNNALYIAEKYAWKKVKCVYDNNVRSIESIHKEIYDIVIKLI